MNTLAHSGIFWAGLIAGLVLLYFLPTMIGVIRKVESLGLLIFLNVLPTGVGWFAATPVARPAAYTVTNPVTNRSFDTVIVTTQNLAQVVGTLIADLKNYGLLQ